MDLQIRSKIKSNPSGTEFPACSDGEAKPRLGINPDRFVVQGKIHYCACTEEVIIFQIPFKCDRDADGFEGFNIDF